VSLTHITRIILVAVFGGLALAGCMDPTLAGSGMVTSSLSIAEAPLGVSEIDIRIRGRDFDPINLTVNRNIDALILELPVGKNRLFEGRAGTYFARTVASVTPNGANVGLNFWPVLIVPDTNNNRLVQVWRPDQPVWETNSYDGQPVDVDFDQGGRIIVADSNNGILRFDSIYDDTPEFVVSTSGISSVAVDREKSIIYFSVGFAGQTPGLFRATYQGASQQIGQATPSRITIDDEGYLYLVNGLTVGKYNPATNSVGPTFVVENAETIEDIQFAGGSIYLAVPWGAPGQQIVRLSKSLGFEAAFGESVSDPANPAPGEFYAPRGFVTDRRGLLVVRDAGGGYSRLVFLNPNNPGAWATYGSNGSGEGQFSF
jgi:hypothetical protein